MEPDLDRRPKQSASGLRTGRLVRHGRESRAGVQFCAGKLHLGSRGAQTRVWALRWGARRTRCPPRPPTATRAPPALLERATALSSGSRGPWGLRGPHRAALWNGLGGASRSGRALSSLRRGRSGYGKAYAELLHRLTHISRRGWATGTHSLGALSAHRSARAVSEKKTAVERGDQLSAREVLS